MATKLATLDAAANSSWTTDGLDTTNHAANGHASYPKLDEAATGLSEPVCALVSADAASLTRLLEDAATKLRSTDAEPHANATRTDTVQSPADAAVPTTPPI